ncbi:dolichol-phosphate mannosyltransferase subunit 3-like [Stegodyphus dumicola]|uniref:dolichol-phosphate mannosyltransferase subunit 3-like n=1 Tax=Stegodyphus dumicola TaxID=202533 RepID=UPI0015B1591C|nr:dolichol-phosphate mannosyltransferase subunit 3-like [Stegodyphus dumicola]
MSKLLEWLAGVALIISVWYSLLINNIFLKENDWHSWLVPIYAVIAFGIYSLIVILYRVYTFNDCPEAAEELKMVTFFINVTF